MTRDEIRQFLNLLRVMYPSAVKESENPKIAEKYIEVYQRQLNKFEYRDCENGLYLFQRNNETNFPPNMKQIIVNAQCCQRERMSKVGVSQRRIVTPEEDCWNEYKEITKKGIKNLSNEEMDRAKQLMPYVMLFDGEGHEERYKKYFNTELSREEYERL